LTEQSNTLKVAHLMAQVDDINILSMTPKKSIKYVHVYFIIINFYFKNAT
jgi:hypothetical protein